MGSCRTGPLHVGRPLRGAYTGLAGTIGVGPPVGREKMIPTNGSIGRTGLLRGGRGNDAAGDAVAGVAAGVGLHVVQLLVDDDGGAPVGDDAVGGGGVEGEVVELEGGVADVAFPDGDVLGKIAGVVAHGILKAVLLG